MALNLRHQTRAQFLARLRERYRNAGGDDAARIAAVVADAIDAGDYTDAQMRAALGMTASQWAAEKSKMSALRDQRNAIKTARGV